jgi:hypothetical protein
MGKRKLERVSSKCHVTAELSLSGTVRMLPAEAHTLMFGVFSLCAVAEKCVAPTNSSPEIPAIDISLPHRA